MCTLCRLIPVGEEHKTPYKYKNYKITVKKKVFKFALTEETAIDLHNYIFKMKMPKNTKNESEFN